MYTSFADILSKVNKEKKKRVSVANAHDEAVLLSLKEASSFVEPILIGDPAKINELAEKISFDISKYDLITANTEDEAGFLAAKQVTLGKAHFLMKGLINTTPFLRGLLHKDLGLKTDNLLSHLSVFAIPKYEKLLFLTDGGLNIAPTFEQKINILQNALLFIRKLGIKEPKVAVLAANEIVSEKMPVTLEAKKLEELGEQGVFGEAIIAGPLSFDLAVSKKSAVHKKSAKKIQGDADLLLVPSIEAGNLMSKAITYFADGTMAGVVLGAKVPAILVSRSDPKEAKLASLALAYLVSED